jgi:hypothetical protein
MVESLGYAGMDHLYFVERIAVSFYFYNIFILGGMKKKIYFLHFDVGRWTHLGKFIISKIKMGCCLL